jgi:hypothetical protein
LSVEAEPEYTPTSGFLKKMASIIIPIIIMMMKGEEKGGLN